MRFYLLFLFCATLLQTATASNSVLEKPDTIPVHAFYRDTFCSNQLVIINNMVYGPANPTGVQTIPNGATNGGDSIIHIELSFFTPPETTLQQTLCDGDTLWVNGVPYHATHYIGDERISGGAANGCDSIVHVNLSVQVAPFKLLYDTLCPDGFLLVNGVKYDKDNRSGLEILPGGSYQGCDSLVFVELKFRELWVYLGADQEITKGDTLCIRPQYGLVPAEFDWSPPPPCTDPECETFCIQPLVPVHYEVTIKDVNGCILSDEIYITISDKNRVYAPNVFNPDADYPNNRFYLGADNGVRLIRRLLIADRWGEVLFDQTNLAPDNWDAGWDGRWRGKIMHSDTYTFWAELERIDGTTFEFVGSTTLIR